MNNTLKQNSDKVLNVLRQAVTENLERKRRLGHYAVVWRDGKPAFIGEQDALPKETHVTETSTK